MGSVGVYVGVWVCVLVCGYMVVWVCMRVCMCDCVGVYMGVWVWEIDFDGEGEICFPVYLRFLSKIGSIRDENALLPRSCIHKQLYKDL